MLRWKPKLGQNMLLKTRAGNLDQEMGAAGHVTALSAAVQDTR